MWVVSSTKPMVRMMKMSHDVLARIGKAGEVFARLKPVWRTSSLSRKPKLRIFSSNVKSVLLSRAGTERITNDLLNKLQVFVKSA